MRVVHGFLVLLLPWAFLCPVTAHAENPETLLNKARVLVQKHQYDESRTLYKKLIAQTADDGEKAGLERELNYVLPYYEAEYYYRQGALEKAQEVIVAAMRANKPWPDRGKKLKKLGVQILAKRQEIGAESRPPDEKTVARKIGEIFKAYHRSHHTYPPDYDALNALLPPGKGLLKWYDVIGYKGGKRLYSIQLRNREEHSQVLDLSGGNLVR